MNTKHTPGPWSCWNTRVGKQSWECVGHDGQLVADLSWCDTETQEANARLIAAAPELIGVLSKLCALQEDGDVVSWAAEWDEARAIIAKCE